MGDPIEPVTYIDPHEHHVEWGVHNGVLCWRVANASAAGKAGFLSTLEREVLWAVLCKQ